MDAKAITVASSELLYPHNQHIDRQYVLAISLVMVLSLPVPHSDKKFCITPCYIASKETDFAGTNPDNNTQSFT
jgi:hypothetical protein